MAPIWHTQTHTHTRTRAHTHTTTPHNNTHTHPAYLHLLLQLEDELARPLPATLGLVHTLMVTQHPLHRFGWGPPARRLLGNLLHQDVVTGVSWRQGTTGVLGFTQSLEACKRIG